MSESKFVPGEKIKVADLEYIENMFPDEDDIGLVDKWAECTLTFSYQHEKAVYTEEADTSFHEDLVESVGFLPDNLFEM